MVSKMMNTLLLLACCSGVLIERNAGVPPDARSWPIEQVLPGPMPAVAVYENHLRLHLKSYNDNPKVGGVSSSLYAIDQAEREKNLLPLNAVFPEEGTKLFGLTLTKGEWAWYLDKPGGRFYLWQKSKKGFGE